jgi:hypothetical protein
MPEVSIPLLDAIKVTTYVNFEFETDYITELARQISLPINIFSNDSSNVFVAPIDEWYINDIEPNIKD